MFCQVVWSTDLSELLRLVCVVINFVDHYQLCTISTLRHWITRLQSNTIGWYFYWIKLILQTLPMNVYIPHHGAPSNMNIFIFRIFLYFRSVTHFPGSTDYGPSVANVRYTVSTCTFLYVRCISLISHHTNPTWNRHHSKRSSNNFFNTDKRIWNLVIVYLHNFYYSQVSEMTSTSWQIELGTLDFPVWL